MLNRETIIDLASAKMPEEKIAEHLIALSVDNITVDIIIEFVDAIKETANMAALNSVLPEETLLDCCGTGGSGLPHFNTSTAAAFVLAAGGVNIAKFGSRSATGLSGSFDFLEALEIPTVSDSSAVDSIFAETKIVFLFAPHFYPTLAKLAPIRKRLGIRTIFNIIGPLLNPANPNTRIMGTQPGYVQSLVAEYLSKQSGLKKSCVVSAASGLDEFDPNGQNVCLTVTRGAVEENTIENLDMGDSPNKPLTTDQNVEMFLQLIDTFDQAPSYFKRLLLLNAAAAFQLTGTTPSIEHGQELAVDLLRSGSVKHKFMQVKNAYAKYSR